MADLEKNEAVEEVAENTAEETVKKEKTKKAAAKKDKKKKKENKIKKFFRDYKSEMKKIVWCSGKTTFQYTILVLVVIMVVGFVIGGLDYGFSKLFMLIGKLV